MDYQKDTQKNSHNSYGHNARNLDKSLINKPAFEFVNKKTEKLVTALYMVTDCMEEGDALKSKIRIIGAELLSDTYKIENLSPVDKASYISRSLGRISEVLSFVGIATTIGYISEMNGSILSRELAFLSSELNDMKGENSRFTFTLGDNMFDVPTPKRDIKDIPKRTFNMSFRNRAPLSLNKDHVSSSHSSATEIKERSNKILNLIKDSKNLDGLSIKDIAIEFKDCSEKTIQRDLNSLVAKGSIKKIGAKRWSRYMAA